MAGRYERVNVRDNEEPESPSDNSANYPLQSQPIPNSPPPSFHSRTSSTDRQRQNRVDPALADAFDSDDSDDEADDTQRLIRGQPATSQSWAGTSSSTSSPPLVVSGASLTGSGAPPMRRPPVPERQVTEFPISGGQAAESTGAGVDRNAAVSGAGHTPMRIYGGGLQSDGVFSNLAAKPERGEEKDEAPPTYEQAAADQAPPYWETTILAPGMGGVDEVYIDGMPVGSIFSFIWNGMISLLFQPVGFVLTYLLHSTHAAKNGSLSGLGITLIQYGFYMKGTSSSAGSGSGAGAMGSHHGGGTPEGYASPPDPNAHEFDPSTVGMGNGGDGNGGGGGVADITGSDWFAYILMILGWFILIRAVSNYIRARRHEQLVLQSPDRGLGVAVVAEGETPDHVV